MLDAAPVTSPRRQWGAERKTAPLAIMHPMPSSRKIVLGRLAMIVTIFAWLMYVITMIMREFIEGDATTLRFVLEATSYLLVVTFLSFSALMYLLARQGALYRFRDHHRAPRGPLDAHFNDGKVREITVLVPSYKEEPEVIAKTLWSAALQEFPSKRIVLLIDDPPHPTDPADRELLERARALPAQIEAELAEPAAHLAAVGEELTEGLAAGDPVAPDLVALVSRAYTFAAEWLEEKADNHPLVDHTDAFFADRVLLGLAGDLRLTTIALDGALDQGEAPPAERLEQ